MKVPYTASLGVKKNSFICISLRTKDLGNTKIDQLEVVTTRLQEKKILGFDVSMDNIHRMHVLNGFHKLGKVVSSFFFGKACLSLHNSIEKLAAVTKPGYLKLLHDKVDVFLVFKHFIELDDVGVV